MNSLIPPPPPPPPSKARRPRHSPRSVVTNSTSPTSLPKKKLNFDEVDDSSFLAGFSAALKFADDDSWNPIGDTNPFQEAKAAAVTPNQGTSTPSTSLTAATATYQFADCFQSKDPFEDDGAQSDRPISEATTAIGSNLLADKLLQNILASKSDVVASPAPVDSSKTDAVVQVSPAPSFMCPAPVSENVTDKSPKKVANNMFVTPENSPRKVNINAPVRNWSRSKVKEELQRRSTTLKEERSNKQDDINRNEVQDESEFHSSSTSSNERRKGSDEDEGEDFHRVRSHLPRSSGRDKDIYLFNSPNNVEEESTLCDDENSYETNSLTYRDNTTVSFTEDDSLSFLTPTPSSHRSRYSRRGGHGRFFCGCDDTDRMAATVRDLKGVIRDINKSMLQVLSPMRHARRYGVREPTPEYVRRRTYDDRPRRRQSHYAPRRSRSISVRRRRSPNRSRRGRSCDLPREIDY